MAANKGRPPFPLNDSNYTNMEEFIDISSQTLYCTEDFRAAIQDVLRLVSLLMRTEGQVDSRMIGKTIFVLQWLLDDVEIIDGTKPKRPPRGGKK